MLFFSLPFSLPPYLPPLPSLLSLPPPFLPPFLPPTSPPSLLLLLYRRYPILVVAIKYGATIVSDRWNDQRQTALSGNWQGVSQYVQDRKTSPDHAIMSVESASASGRLVCRGASRTGDCHCDRVPLSYLRLCAMCLLRVLCVRVSASFKL